VALVVALGAPPGGFRHRWAINITPHFQFWAWCPQERYSRDGRNTVRHTNQEDSRTPMLYRYQNYHFFSGERIVQLLPNKQQRLPGGEETLPPICDMWRFGDQSCTGFMRIWRIELQPTHENIL
jgi:hypothetical protein